MGKIKVIKNHFSAGVIDEDLSSRQLEEDIATSVLEMENFNLMINGTLKKRSGTRYVDLIKYNDKNVKLLPIDKGDDGIYLAVVQAGYFRFAKYQEDGSWAFLKLKDDSTKFYEIANDFTNDQVATLDYYCESNKAIITHSDFFPKVLFTKQYSKQQKEQAELEKKELNLDQFYYSDFYTENHGYPVVVNKNYSGDLYFQFSNYGNEKVVFEFSRPSLNFTDPAFNCVVGGTYKIYHQNVNSNAIPFADITILELDKKTITVTFALGSDPVGVTFPEDAENKYTLNGYQIQKNTGKNIKITASQNYKFLINEVMRFDTTISDQIESIIIKITKDTSTKDTFSAEGIVLYPSTISSEYFASNKLIYQFWEQGMSESKGYPSSVNVYSNRLIFGRGDYVFLSQTSRYSNFCQLQSPSSGIKPTATGDNSPIVLKISDMFEIKTTLWIEKCSIGILIASIKGIFLISSTVNKSVYMTESITPINVFLKQISFFKPSNVKPIYAFGSTFFVEAGNVRLIKLTVSETGLPDETILNVYNRKYFKGIKEIRYENLPYQRILCLKDDGTIAFVDFNTTAKTVGTGLIKINGSVKQISSLNGKNKTEVLYITNRTDKQYILEQTMEGYDFDDSISNAWYVDSGVLIESKTLVTTINGFSNFTGKTLCGIADGKSVKNVIVDENGNVELPYPATKVLLGFEYKSTLSLLPIKTFYSIFFSSIGERVKIMNAYFDVFKTADLKLMLDGKSVDFREFGQSINHSSVEFKTTLLQNDLSIWNGTNRQGPCVSCYSDDPLPCNIAAISYEVLIEDKNK